MYDPAVAIIFSVCHNSTTLIPNRDKNVIFNIFTLICGLNSHALVDRDNGLNKSLR